MTEKRIPYPADMPLPRQDRVITDEEFATAVSYLVRPSTPEKVQDWAEELDELLVTTQVASDPHTATRLERIRSIVRTAIEVHQYSAPTSDPKVDVVQREKMLALGRAIYGAGI